MAHGPVWGFRVKLIRGEIHHKKHKIVKKHKARKEKSLLCKFVLSVAFVVNPLVMKMLWSDFRYSLRVLRNSPGLSALAALSLAIGIGANSAIFSVVNAVLLRPLPYPEPERLVMVWEHHFQSGRDRARVAPNNFIDWQKSNRVFDEIAAVFALDTKNLSGAGEPEQVQCHRVSANFFPLLGVGAFLGRTFSQKEDMPHIVGTEEMPHGDRVVILSHGLWQRSFAGDREIVGKTVQLDRQSHTVIGVLPPGFRFMDQPADAWIPLGLDPAKDYRALFGRFLWVPARLKAGVSLQQAREELNVIAGQLQQQHPVFNAGWGANIVPLDKQVIGDIRLTLLVLFGAVGFVLMIACANVANLRLAQASAREKEVAIRASLGASRLRLIRLMLSENLVLAVLGAALGLLLAYWLVKVFVALAPRDIPRLSEITLDGRVLGLTIFVSLMAGIISGLAPAWHASKIDLNEALKEGGKSSVSGARGNRLRGLFIIAEFALALVLLICAGLMIRSFLSLQAVDLGFNPQNLLTMRLILPLPAYFEVKKRTAFFEQAIQGIEELPGVRSASAVNWLPFSGSGMNTFFMIEGRHSPDAVDKPRADIRTVSSNYFKTMGIPLRMGRDFTKRDITEKDAKVVIINETMARRFWPNESPLGRRIRINRPEYPPDEIIGVVSDVKNSDFETEVLPTVYWPHHRWPSPFGAILVRSTVDPTSLSAAVTRQIRSLDPEQSIAEVRTMEQVLWSSVARPRFNTLLLSVFAAVAFFLAAMGIYGVMSYAVTQRAHEVGIRMALGAQKRDVLKLIIRHGIMLTLIGVGVGLLASYALTRVLAGLLYGVKPTDPATFIGVPLLLSAVALLACYIPARRATKVDPMTTLRHQ
jgi:putative ABC transport system permease protein